jgi:MFS family permease
MLRVFRHRNYALIASGNFVNQLGMWGRMIGIGWAAQALTHSPFLVGLAHGSQFLPTLLLAPISGLVADRFDRRNVAIVGNIGMAIPSGAICFLLIADRLTITGLVLLALVGGCLQSFTTPAITALVPHAVPARDVQAAIAMNNVLSNVSRFLGAALVGVIITAYGTAAAFAFNAGSLIVVALPWLAVRVAVPPRELDDESFVTQLAAGFRFARHQPAVGNLLVLNTIVGLLIMQQPLIPLVTRDLLHAGPSTYGLLQSVTGVGAIAGALFAGRAATGARRRSALALAVLATAASVVGVAVSSWVALSVVVQMVFGFGLFSLMTSSVTIITLSTPDKYLGRVMSLHGMTIAGMVPINAMAAGLLANAIGTRATLALAGSLLSAYVTWFIIRRLKLVDVASDQEDLATVLAPTAQEVAALLLHRPA